MDPGKLWLPALRQVSLICGELPGQSVHKRTALALKRAGLAIVG